MSFKFQTNKFFRREVNLLYMLKDEPGIIDIKGFTLEPNSIVLEYAEYGDLSKYLKNQKTELTLSEKTTIGEQIALAINSLHSFQPKIAHRDLKSLNVLVTSLNPLVVKVSDFETACFIPNFFVSGKSVIDNPIWMAPELILGTK